MIDWFTHLHPVSQAFIATLFTWMMTAAGAAVVFLRKEMSRVTLDIMLGFTAGVMIAASYWSLLAPSIAMSENGSFPSWLPPATGFMAGALALRAIDWILPHVHIWQKREEAEGISTTWRRTYLLVLAITLHNIPEGLAVGVAFGALAHDMPGATLGGAVALALGIGIQNLPEGTAVSMPLRREGVGQFRSWWFGQLSAVVEPVAGVAGAAVVLLFQPLLPYALAFAAGAMIFVVIEEVIPESQSGGNADWATMGAMGGFTIMMILDVALG